MNKTESSAQDDCWYVYINEQTKGPMGLRDLDVLIRTNQITSNTYCWKNGMKQWKPLIQIQQIKQNILQPSNEANNKQDKEQIANSTKPNNQTQAANEQQQDHMIENQDENPLAILEATVQNLIKKSFHQSEDGKWSIYDEEKQQWILQDEQPIQKITQMKNFLLNKLKSQFFADDKNKRKIKHIPQMNQDAQKPLTKQQMQKKERNKKKAKRAAEKKKQKWYQAKINTFIYISGLPFDTTQQELKQFASKAGVLRIDLTTGKQKIKIYRDENNLPKGDAAVSYARQESVDIALEILNQSQIRDGFIVKVQKAHFNQKDEEYKRRQTKKQTKIKKMLAKKNEDKLLNWQQQAQQKGDGFRIVIMRNVFTFEQANSQSEMSQIKSDITSELQKIGQIKRIRFFDNHPEGIIQIKFQKDLDAEKCVEVMNNRFFDGRQITCQYWDGQTDFKIDAHSLQLQKQRLLLYAGQIQKGNGQLSKIEQKPQQNQNDQLLQ